MILAPFSIYILKSVIQLQNKNLEKLKNQKYWISENSSLFSKIASICFIFSIIIFIYMIIIGAFFNLVENLDILILCIQFGCGAGFFKSLSDIASAIKDLKKSLIVKYKEKKNSSRNI